MDGIKDEELPTRIACQSCASSKTKCDRGIPCSRCQRKKIQCVPRYTRRVTCTDEAEPAPYARAPPLKLKRTKPTPKRNADKVRAKKLSTVFSAGREDSSLSWPCSQRTSYPSRSYYEPTKGKNASTRPPTAPPEPKVSLEASPSISSSTYHGLSTQMLYPPYSTPHQHDWQPPFETWTPFCHQTNNYAGPSSPVSDASTIAPPATYHSDLPFTNPHAAPTVGLSMMSAPVWPATYDTFRSFLPLYEGAFPPWIPTEHAFYNPTSGVPGR